MKPKVSIIIPALNEEDYLPNILKCIKKQTYPHIETIVAISPQTTDQTVKVAKKFGVKIAPGGVYTKARNNGVKMTEGEIFFFLDADVTFKPETIQNALLAIKQQKLDFGALEFQYSKIKTKSNWTILNNIYISATNRLLTIYFRLMSHFIPITFGATTFIKRDLFLKINGYDESVWMCEDLDLGKRASQYGKSGVLPITVETSARRIESQGFVRFTISIVLSLFALLTGNSKLHKKVYPPKKEGDKYK